MKKILTLFALLIAFAVNGFAQDTWTVAGTAAALNGDADFAPANDANDMTSTDGTNFTLVVTDCTLEAGTTYKFKVVKDHSWAEAYPGSDYVFTVTETAKYTVTYTFNADTKAVGVSTEKTGEAGQITHTYTVAGSSEALFGVTWDPTETTNDMTESTTTAGLYTWSKENVALSATGETPIEFKVCVDHAWGTAYPSSNYQLAIAAAGNYNVTITYNSSSHAVNATATQIPNNYTATFDNGGGWTSVYAYAWSGEGDGATEFLGAWPGTALTKTGDVYTVSIDAVAAPEKIIFNNGDHGLQTANLVFVDGQAYTYTINLPGTVIWSSDNPVAANWGNNISIVKEKFASAKVGDKVHIAVEGVTPNPDVPWSAQVMLKGGNWKDLEESIHVGRGDVEVASFVLTGDMLEYIKATGMFAAGEGYSSRKVSLETVGDEPAGSANSIWVGNQTLTWTQASVNKLHFVNADVKAGQFIKLTYAKTGDPNIQLRYGWGSSDHYGTPTYGDGAAILEVTAEMLENLKTKGLIINAAGITLTQVELLSVNNYFVIYDKNDGNGWKVDTTPMIPDEGIPTSYMKAISDVKYFAIAPDIALNAAADGINLWPLVIRPVTESGNFVVALKDYADKTTTGTDNVWEVSGLNTATITYTPASTGETDYTITNCIADIVVTNAAGWATYSNANPYLLSILPETGEMVYIVTGVENGEVVLKKLTDATDGVVSIYVPGGTGILIKGDTDPEDDIICANPAPANATFADVTGNWLIGSNDYTYDITNDGYTAYILAKPENKEVGFYKAALTNEDKTIAAHKAFLAVPTTGNAPEFILIGGGDGTTGINATINDTVNDNAIFDLSGRRVVNPTKGIYIVNGKKVVIK